MKMVRKTHMRFREDQISQLTEDFLKINLRFNNLYSQWGRVRLNEKSRMYVQYGFLRRCSTIKYCVHEIYTLCPPNVTKLKDFERKRTEIFMHEFVLNFFGIMDNLALILSYHFGFNISQREIGLFPKKKFNKMRRLLSKDFNQKVSKYDNDFTNKYLKDFRHPLAHRIPFYIPPSILSEPSDQEEWNKLIKKENESLLNGNLQQVDDIQKKQDQLGYFAPIILTIDNDFRQGFIYFHPQILADCNTVFEISSLVLDEINK